MSVTNGQNVDAAVTNAAFVSKTANSTVTGAITLNKPSGSGAMVADVQAAINDGIDDLAAHLSDTSTHGVAVAIVGTTDVQVITNKDIDGGVATNARRITLPKETKTNLDALTRKQGTLVYDTVTNKPYYDDGTNLVEVGSGSGGGSINFIENSDAEDGSTTGWLTYADAAGTRPVDGTGGSASVTWTATSTNPLNGTSSFLFTKDAANRQGQGVSADFDIPLAFRAKALTVKVPYIVNSGTFVAGTSSTDSDVIIYFYDITNSKLVEPSSFKFLSNSTTVSDAIQATVQFDSNCTSARMIIHVATTSASAYVLKLDDVSVGPANYQYGTPVTDPQTFVPSISTGVLGTGGTQLFSWGRNGKMMDIQFTYEPASAGTAGSGTYTFTIPTGASVDTAFVAANGHLGDGYIYNGSTIETDLVVSYSSATTFVLRYSTSATAMSTVGSSNFPLSNSGTRINFKASIPILGWSSSVQTSDQTDTRVVDFTANKSGNEAVTGAVTNISFTSIKDSHGAWTGTTYVVQVPGDYYVGAVLAVTSSATTLSAYKNGTQAKYIGTLDSSGHKGGNVILTGLVTGDVISFRIAGSLTIVGDANNSASISRISGPSAIASNELIYANYYNSAGSSFTNNGEAIVDFGTKVDDSHGAVTTGASWRFTAPTAGLYDVDAVVNFVMGTSISVQYLRLALFKNGTLFKSGPVLSTVTPAVGTPYCGTGFSGAVRLNAGEYIEMRCVQNSGNTRSLQATTYDNTISIKKVGP